MLDDLVVLPQDQLTLAVVEEERRDHHVQLDPHLLSRLLLRVMKHGRGQQWLRLGFHTRGTQSKTVGRP